MKKAAEPARALRGAAVMDAIAGADAEAIEGLVVDESGEMGSGRGECEVERWEGEILGGGDSRERERERGFWREIEYEMMPRQHVDPTWKAM